MPIIKKSTLINSTFVSRWFINSTIWGKHVTDQTNGRVGTMVCLNNDHDENDES